MKVVCWGTYDTGKPRNRILLKGLRENHIEIIECHAEIWGGIEDKSQLCGFRDRFKRALSWVLCYPALILRYLRLPRHDAVVVGYMGQVDVLVLFFFAGLRGTPIIWDAFLSLYDSVVWDRKIVSPKNPLAFLLYALEWLACRAADRIILDTWAHANYFQDSFHLKNNGKLRRLFVGAEMERFPSGDNLNYALNPSLPFTILFYGQFIPLHGIEYIVRAAKLTEDINCQWILVGKGQESDVIKKMCLDLKVKNIKQVEWVPYLKLVEWIHRADVGLGIFGTTDKAKRVIPNKVFQLLAAGCPLITGDTPAARELLKPSAMIHLVPVGESAALAVKVRELFMCPLRPRKHDPAIVGKISPYAIGRELKELLVECTKTD